MLTVSFFFLAANVGMYVCMYAYYIGCIMCMPSISKNSSKFQQSLLVPAFFFSFAQYSACAQEFGGGRLEKSSR